MKIKIIFFVLLISGMCFALPDLQIWKLDYSNETERLVATIYNQAPVSTDAATVVYFYDNGKYIGMYNYTNIIPRYSTVSVYINYVIDDKRHELKAEVNPHNTIAEEDYGNNDKIITLEGKKLNTTPIIIGNNSNTTQTSQQEQGFPMYILVIIIIILIVGVVFFSKRRGKASNQETMNLDMKEKKKIKMPHFNFRKKKNRDIQAIIKQEIEKNDTPNINKEATPISELKQQIIQKKDEKTEIKETKKEEPEFVKQISEKQGFIKENDITVRVKKEEKRSKFSFGGLFKNIFKKKNKKQQPVQEFVRETKQEIKEVIEKPENYVEQDEEDIKLDDEKEEKKEEKDEGRGFHLFKKDKEETFFDDIKNGKDDSKS